MPRQQEESLLLNNRNGGVSIVSNGHTSQTGGSETTEKAPFLVEPVRLTPAWEESNLPNDELNFKGMTMERAKMEIDPPKDRLNIVFLTLVLHGIGTLTPWNMFITAKAYFVDYKLSESYTGEKSDYNANFLAYLGFASQIPNLLFNWLNIFVQMGGNLTTRIVWSLLFEVLLFVVTVGLAMSDTSSMPGVFFWVTMMTVVLLNMAGGIYQNSVYGMAAKLPIKYTGAVVLGSNISGTFAAIMSLISNTFAESVRTAAIYYFITAMFVLLICFDTYFALPLNKFYKYHEMLAEKEQQRIKRAGFNTDRPPYWKIFKDAFPQLFNVFLIFFVTLTVFPAVHSDIKRTDENFIIPGDMFTTVTCFLTFNFCAMLGSLLTSWVKFPSPRFLVWPVVARLAFIPLFLVCNYLPKDVDRVLPIYITNDYVYWAIAIVMSVSSGYLSSLGMMYTPSYVESRYAPIAGMYAAASLITGIFTGILCSMGLPWLVGHLGW
ncbi:equilibrative nucleoside transporter 3 isoform X2 [Culicoides brevitarsis]|uniref:equilibrative nucleoside transporter 3 isoform X2 n=1 Tax=Culicoides brevitarsis TaxID=469753 RepID=UPI00307BF6D9